MQAWQRTRDEAFARFIALGVDADAIGETYGASGPAIVCHVAPGTDTFARLYAAPDIVWEAAGFESMRNDTDSARPNKPWRFEAPFIQSEVGAP